MFWFTNFLFTIGVPEELHAIIHAVKTALGIFLILQ